MDHTSPPLFIQGITSLAALSPAELAQLLNILLHCERAPGGPYALAETLAENIAANLHIYSLFYSAGKSLPNVLGYVAASHQLLSPPQRETLHHLQQPPAAQPAASPAIAAFHQEAERHILARTPPELRDTISAWIRKVAHVDRSGEITQLASTALPLFGAAVSQQFCAKSMQALGLSNFYTWLAYSLYDNALDESDRKSTIPLATIIQRLAIESYASAPSSHAADVRAFHKALDAVDTANILELTHCRAPVHDGLITLTHIPDKKLLTKLLSQRSAVHYFGVWHSVQAYVAPSVHRQQKKILDMYCAARQLSDDIHDWEDDLQQGRITYVVAHFIKAAGIHPGTHSFAHIIPKLRQCAWEKELAALIKECLATAYQVRSGYQEVFQFPKDSAFDALTIAPIITALETSLNHITFNKSFLEIMSFKEAKSVTRRDASALPFEPTSIAPE